MADFIRFRFHGAHGASAWDYKYIPDVDDADIDNFVEETTDAFNLQGEYPRLEAEEVIHPGNEWLLKEAKRMREKAKSLEHTAFKFESLDTGRNSTPLMHHSV